jgi:colanic acid/amylovoran biosynthesis glycosyltransferase
MKSVVLETAKSYYDHAASQGLADYVYGNPRVDAAIRHALRSIPSTSKTILDIGCGIGRSSWEFERHFPSASIVAVDLSPKRIEFARLLFPSARIDFRALDILHGYAEFPNFDAIVMLDVYEHIAQDARRNFHNFIREKLTPGGTWILSCPTIGHQEYLRKNDPGGLQPIDENVSEPDLQDAAVQIEGTLISFQSVTIWRKDDYFHATLRRKGSITGLRSTIDLRLETDEKRSQRVQQRAGIRVTRSGVMLPDRSGPSVCLIQPNRNVYSETFIRNHAERLPARVRMLHTGWFPTRREDDRRLLRLPVELILKAQRSVPPRIKTANTFLMDKTLCRYLRKNSVDVVLAEYGLTGAAVMNACRDARVPLVVHFHGFDAYHFPTLNSYGAQYVRMFEMASAIVAVSRDMEQQLIALGAPQNKVHYCPYGVDIELFEGADPAMSKPTFVATGRFVDKKAPYLTLLAFRTVVSRIPEARLVFFGDGPLLDTCKQLTKTLGLSGHIEFRGPRPNGEVAETLRSSRAFVQHSIRPMDGDSEGTPVAILEAGAAGLPVVATRHAGIKDVVIERETGFLVDEGDIGTMADHMIHLAQSPSVAGTMGQQARKHITGNFSLEKGIGRLWTVLENAIASRR